MPRLELPLLTFPLLLTLAVACGDDADSDGGGAAGGSSGTGAAATGGAGGTGASGTGAGSTGGTGAAATGGTGGDANGGAGGTGGTGGSSGDSCASILAGDGSAVSGTYDITPSGSAAPISVYCDMTTFGGGWTLVARVLSDSTTHSVAAEIGTLTSPTQNTTAKLADTVINAIKTNRAWLQIPGMSTDMFVDLTAIDVDLEAAVEYGHNNVVSLTDPDGPFTSALSGDHTCGADCGVFVNGLASAQDGYCGYHYFLSTGDEKPGMGCKAGFGHDGTLWVR